MSDENEAIERVRESQYDPEIMTREALAMYAADVRTLLATYDERTARLRAVARAAVAPGLGIAHARALQRAVDALRPGDLYADAPAPEVPASVPVAELRAVRHAAREVLAGLDGDGTSPCALCGREGEHSDGGDCNVLEIALALCDTAEAKGGET